MNTDMQVEALKAAFPDAVLQQEKKTGTTTKDRFAINVLLDMIKAGDRLVVWNLDRLARNMDDLTNIIETLNRKGAALEILDQNIDTSQRQPIHPCRAKSTCPQPAVNALGAVSRS